MAHTSRTHPRRGRGALLATPAAVTSVSMLLLFSTLFLSCVVPAITSTTFTRMAYAATPAEPPRCHVDYSRYTGKTTSKGSWAGLHFHLVFTLGLCTRDPDDGVMSVQLNERHVNFTGRSGSVAVPHLGLVRFNLSAPTIGPQYFTSELCYSEVNCTNLCTNALMGHVGTCKVDRVIMPVLIVLLWMVPTVACVGFLAAMYLRKLAKQRRKALDQSPEVFGTSPAASRTWRPLQRAPSTPRPSSSSHAVFTDEREASQGGSHEAALEHASEALVVIPVHGNYESLPPRLRSAAPPNTFTSCSLPERKEVEMAALRAVDPPSLEQPSEKHRHTSTHNDDYVTGTATVRLPEERHFSPDLPAPSETLETTVQDSSSHPAIPQVNGSEKTNPLNCSTQQPQPKRTSVQALEEAGRLRAELEAAEEAARLEVMHEAEQARVQALEEAARLEAVHEAEQARVQALEEAGRLRAELEAAEEAARLVAVHEAEQARVQALEEAGRLRAELGAAEEAARLEVMHEAEQARVQALEEAARLEAVHEAEQARVQALEEAGRLRAELEAAEEEKDERAGTLRYNEDCKGRVLYRASPDSRRPLPRPFIGLSLSEDVERSILIVDGLYRDGPAYQTGIRLGDVLLRIAGVHVDSIAKARQVVDARCCCGRVVPVTLATKMNQQYSVALYIMTVDPEHKDKPYFFDVHMHHRIESSHRGKRAQWMEVLERPSVSSAAATPLVPLLRETTPRRGSVLQSSARSAFVATSYFSSARRSVSSESERSRGSSSAATAEEAIALAPQGYTPPNQVRGRS